MMKFRTSWQGATCRALLFFLLSAPALIAQGSIAVQIKGRVTNQFTEEQYRAVEIIVTDRLGVEVGRVRPNKRGRYVLKVSAPKYIILKARLEGYPTGLYQIDTKEYRESTRDRAENRAFGAMRIQTYYQNVSFKMGSVSAEASAPLTFDDLLAREDPKAVKAYRQAREQKEAGLTSKAARSLEKLIEEFPSFYIGYIDLGMMLVAQQETDRAMGLFQLAQALRPDHSLAYAGLGMALNAKGDHQSAVEPLRKAVEIDPDSVNAQFELGQASFKLGDSDQALECFRRVVGLDPKFNPMAYKIMTSLYGNKQDPAGAAGALEAYLDHFPDALDRARVEEILRKLGGQQ